MSPILVDTNAVSVIFKSGHPLRPAALEATDGHEWPMNAADAWIAATAIQ